MRHLQLASLLAFLLCGSCALPQLDVAPRLGLMSLDGDFGTSAGSLSASADLDNIGLDDGEGALGLRADLSFLGSHVILGTTQMDFSGSGTLDAQLSMGGITIPLGAQVDSDLELGMHQALLLWDIFPGNLIELSAGVGVTLLDFDMQITDTGTGLSVNADESLPIPLLAANAGVMLGPLEANLLISGFSISADGNSGSFLDIDAALRYQLMGGANHLRSSIILGWRQVDIELDYTDSGDEIKGEIGLSGPYLAFELTL